MTEGELILLMAVLNFITEEKPYRKQALINEAFLYAQWMWSKQGFEYLTNAFTFNGTELDIPALSDFSNSHVFSGASLTYNGECKVFNKGCEAWNYLVEYRRIRNTIVG